MNWSKSAISMAVVFGLSACGGGSDNNDTGGSDTGQAITITSALEDAQQRLPCETGTGEYCDLRVYQIMVESFIDGDSSYDYGVGYGTSHHNGDIQGIINSLDYIKALGVNAIWLTPVFASNEISGQDQWADMLDATGYFASDYFNIDPNFGSLELAKQLVTEAHEKGLYVFFDGVFGHHKSNIVASPNGLTPAIDTTSGNQVVVDYDDADTLGFYQEVINYWTTELCLDGWRLDQAYQVPLEDWQALRSTLDTAGTANTTNADCQTIDGNGDPIQWGNLGYMVAEVWKANDSIINEAYGSTGNETLPSAFDFMRRYALVQTLAVEESGSGAQNVETLIADWNAHSSYPEHAQPNLMLGNHDLVRFGDLIQRSGLADIDDEAYWNRHKAAFTYMAAYSGPITLYYGDEIGDELAGYAAQDSSSSCAINGLCDDHVSRTSGNIAGVTDSFTPSTEQQDLMDYVKDLMAVRAANPALYQGSVQNLYADGETNVLVILKDDSSQRVLYLLNASSTEQTVSLAASLLDNEGTLTDLMTDEEILVDENGNLNITLSGLSGRLLLVEP